jgi:hypothetical protein
MTPLWDPWCNPLLDAVTASGLPMHLHTIGSGAGHLPAATRQKIVCDNAGRLYAIVN